MNSTQFWETTCSQAFNNHLPSSNFILFFESCKSLTLDKQAYLWQTQEFQDELRHLGCLQQDSVTFLLPAQDYATLFKAKSRARSQWHQDRQIELRLHLHEVIDSVSPVYLVITKEQRLALVREFMRNHEKDIGSVPFIQGVVGLLNYQLQQKQFLVEWEMSEYVLTQNNEEAIDAYIRLLRGVLGLQMVVYDEARSSLSQQDPAFTWRMNDSIDRRFIQQCIVCLNKNRKPHTLFTDNYKVTNIPFS